MLEKFIFGEIRDEFSRIDDLSLGGRKQPQSGVADQRYHQQQSHRKHPRNMTVIDEKFHQHQRKFARSRSNSPRGRRRSPSPHSTHILKQAQTRGPSKLQPCQFFEAGMTCDLLLLKRCRYLHACLKCGSKDHPMKECPKKITH